MKKIITFLTSMSLAVVLILTIAILSLLSTLIPQGENPEFYSEKYPGVLAFFIIHTGFYKYSTSLLLIVPVVFFSINLTACTIKRLIREFTKKIPIRYGPDLIHFGIFILIIGSLFTITGRLEEFIYLGKGDTIELLDGYTLVVDKCTYITYADGRPKDWISTLSIYKAGEPVISSFPVEVNKPLSFKGLKILQTDYSNEPILIVTDKDGNEFRWLAGHLIETPNSTILFHGINANPGDKDDIAAMFEENFHDNTMNFIPGKPGDIIGDYSIKELSMREVTGLTFIIDPGFIPVIIGLILIGIGLSLTFIQKMGVMKK